MFADPPSLVSSRSSPNHSQPGRHLSRSDDERRLLRCYGYASEWPGVVNGDYILAIVMRWTTQQRSLFQSLGKSARKRKQNPRSAHPEYSLCFIVILSVKQKISGGLRPVNTLTMSNGSHDRSSQSHRPVAGLTRGNESALQVAVSIGSNVRQQLPLSEQGDFDLPSAKRRKAEEQIKPMDAPSLSSDGIDPLSMGSEHQEFASLSRETRKTRHPGSGRGQMKASPRPTVEGCVKEYQSVENIMNSAPSKPNQKKTLRNRSQTQSFSRSESVFTLDRRLSSTSNHIDLSVEDESLSSCNANRPTRGKQRESDEEPIFAPGVRDCQAAVLQAKANGEQSHHFTKSDNSVRTSRVLYIT